MNLCVVDWIRIGSWKKLCRESHWNITEDLTSSLGVIPRCAPSTTDHNNMLACCGPWVKACVWSYPQEMLVHSQSYSNGLLGYNRIVISCECVRACMCARAYVCVCTCMCVLLVACADLAHHCDSCTIPHHIT